MDEAGVTHLNHFYLPRVAQYMSLLWREIHNFADLRIRLMLRFWFDSHVVNLSIQNRYRPEVVLSLQPDDWRILCSFFDF